MTKESTASNRPAIIASAMASPLQPNIPPETKHTELENLHLLENILGGLILTRPSLLLVAEAGVFGWATVGHYLLIFYPTAITIYSFMNISRKECNHFVRKIFSVCEIVLLFALGWAIPAGFASSEATLPFIFLIMSLARIYVLLTKILKLFLKREATEWTIYSSLIIPIPAIVWVCAYLIESVQISLILLILGTILDLFCYLILQYLDLQCVRHNQKHQFHKIRFNSLIVFALSLHYFWEKRIVGNVLESELSVNFDLEHFSHSILAVIITILLYKAHDAMLKRFEFAEVQKVKAILVFGQLFSLMNISAFVFIVGSLQITLQNIFNPLIFRVKFPVDQSIPMTEIIPNSSISIGIPYLTGLTSSIPLEHSTLHISGLLYTFGIFGFTLAISNLVLKYSDFPYDKHQTGPMLIPFVLLVIAVFWEWDSSLLLIFITLILLISKIALEIYRIRNI
jgi:hypothetical protein